MKIVIAPDSFKGSISARDLCASIRKGILNVDPDVEVIELPLADGGEGTLENMVYSTDGKVCELEVRDPLERPIRASYGVLGDGRTVIIEMAQASGLPLLKEHERNPLIATSFGTGELIRHALDSGYRRFIIGLGGSATNDGGTGMLTALGAKFLNQNGALLPSGGAALEELASIDVSGMDPRLKESSFTIASDVTNPLCGPDGASAIFGPQKGATPDMVQRLDMALNRFGEIILNVKGVDMRQVPGSGAAGGMGAALMAFLQAECKPGIEIVTEAIHFEKHIQNADLIITGEGKLDLQTLSGKVIAGVCRKAKPYGIPTIALCGGMELSSEQMDQIGLKAGFSIVPKPCHLDEAMQNTAVWAQERVEQIMRLLQINK
ncbi:glycerate kinase [Brevibacillus agri]|uniref:glycerate kinase n=1 Tax=Brevibacillus agri TaxID=51101 RepID=UPI0018CF27A1|nr:glycerate kinase [Brevibacillus agri]MBG9567093.1 glycerate kinase [Brevibacillus agri]MBG9568393.1 glycerate kinase [Brevibacillus agri]MBG9568401.1 glycerate kinase [Brevibacillus agri]